VIKAIIFDCFGVLSGSSFKEIYRQAGGDLSKDEGFIDDVLTAANSGFITTQEMHQQVAERIKKPLEEWVVFVRNRELPNEDLLAYIKELRTSFKIAVLSNANFGVLEHKFSTEQLALFNVRTVSAEVGVMKPDPEIYTITAERLSVDPSECVFTDDNPHYAEAAEAVGMKSIWYQNLDQFKRELEQILSTSGL
jgi:putative hydrolase of the HAD superfamily